VRPGNVNSPGDDNSQMTSGLPSPQKRRVLIVDDEPGLLDAMTTAFERAGRSVVGCRTFEEARQKLLSEDFHCLITDVRLGAFNGIQLAVIARDRNPDLSIIIFSGFDDPVLRGEATNVGAYYLVKPVTVERLLELVDAG
jgi:DNA-binding NtrC family response regulator